MSTPDAAPSYPVGEFRDRTAEIFGRVLYKRETVFVTKYRRIVAKIVPVDPEPLVEDPLAKIARGKA